MSAPSASPALAEPKTSVIANGRKRITSKFTDGTEMVEEYDVVTDDLLLRKRRRPNALGHYSDADWVVEVGAEARTRNVERAQIVEAAGSPEVLRQDTKDAHVFRIRNLPYPREVFSVTVEGNNNNNNSNNNSGSGSTGGSNSSGRPAVGEIVVRTSNKKYYKRLDIPDMARAGIPLDPAQLSYEVKNNTLIIQYKKHLAVLAAEAAARKERAALSSKRINNEQEQCAQQ